MDAGDLAVFSAVARAGGITKAATMLNTVQSNVTQRIRLLESELGVPLFHRHTRGVSLTSAGAQLLPYAERIGRLIGEAKQAAANGPEPRGRIVIGSLETTAALRLPPILAAYASAYPDVDIEIDTGTSAALIESVLAHKIEAAFVVGPVDHPELESTPMVEEELVLVTAPHVKNIAALRATSQFKILVFRAGCTYRVHLEALLAAQGIVNLRRLEFGTLEGIIGCVGAGLGVTLLPRAVVANAAREGRVALHDLPRDEARAVTVLVRRKDAFCSTALLRFIETARKVWHAKPNGRTRAARLPAPRPRR